MIQLRTASGEIVPLPANAMFVEVCDTEGGIAAVLYHDTADGMIAIRAGTPHAARYSRRYGGRFVPIQHPPAQQLVKEMQP